MQGNTYNLKFKVKSLSAFNYVKAWIDYNNDSTFNNTNELVLQLSNVSQGFYNQNITIPTTATSGIKRMRIRMNSGYNFTNACDTTTIGQTVDYTVNIGGINDVGVDSIISPTNVVNIGDVIYPTIKIHNFGNTTISNFPLCYTINNGTGIFDTYTGTGIVPGNTAYFTFTTPYNVIPSSFYICTNVQAANDVYAANDIKCKSVAINLAANDVGVTQIMLPLDTIINNSTSKVKVVLQNFGTNPIFLDTLYYQIGSQPIVKEIWTGYLAPVGTIGDSIQYTFNTTFVAPAGVTLNLCSWSTLANDQYAGNDKTCKLVNLCQLPLTPGAITNVTSPGTHTVYFGSIVIFCINNVNSATSFNWICTNPGAVIIGYPNDSCVFIQFNNIGASGNYFLSVQAINSCGIGQSSPNYNLYVTSPGGGIKELNASNNIKLSPNPTSDKLNINIASVKKGKTKFSIYNIQGAKLYNQEDLITTDTYNKIINVGTLKAGIYFIKIENDDGVYNTKFIKE